MTRISCLLLLCCFYFQLIAQSKKGTIKVEKHSIEGLYLYSSENGVRTYIRIFKDSMVMLANNQEDPEYMLYWFDRMARDSNLPKGKISIEGELVHIHIKVAQSKEDDIILDGSLIYPDKLKLKRTGKGFDPNEYLFTKIN